MPIGGKIKPEALKPAFDDYTTSVVPAPRAPIAGVGMILPGNMNVYDRPIVPNPAEGLGHSSTIRSASFGMDNGETLIPTVSDGADGKPPHLMSNPESLEYMRKTHQTLGTFDTPAHATAFGKALHEQQATMQNFGGRTALPPQIIRTPLKKPVLNNQSTMAGPSLVELLASMLK